MEEDLREMLYNKYKIVLSDEEYARLQNVLTAYNVSPTSLTINLYSNITNFVNDITLYSKIKLNRLHSNIFLEEIIFQKNPLPCNNYTEVDVSYPKHFRNKRAREFKVDAFSTEKNMVLIHTTEIDIQKEAVYEERYSLNIFNPELEIHAGILFEKIPNN